VHAPLTLLSDSITTISFLLISQVDEGDIEIVNIRETDARLGPLVFTLVGLGCATLMVTIVFWWLTRPRQPVDIDQGLYAPHDRVQGDVDG
jgi:hypothetical protein